VSHMAQDKKAEAGVERMAGNLGEAGRQAGGGDGSTGALGVLAGGQPTRVDGAEIVTRAQAVADRLWQRAGRAPIG